MHSSPRNPVWTRFALVVLLLCTGVDLHAEPRAANAVCEVVGVGDSVTLALRCGEAPVQSVRLAGIEAPATQALFSGRAQRSLADLLLHRQVRVVPAGDDGNGEMSAQVYLGRLHVNAQRVAEGMARCRTVVAQPDWCARPESSARTQLRGIWSDPWLSQHTGQSPKPVTRKRGPAA